MTLKDELVAYVKETHASKWTTREGQVVPGTADLKHSNDAVKLNGVVLYADLAESTKLVNSSPAWFAAEVYKNYLFCAARLIKNYGGVITAYDGDRVMAVFLSKNKNTQAVNCALRINWAVHEIIRPAIKAKYPDRNYQMQQRVGIDTSDLFVARTGVRGDNDLVWVGNAANNAAKMAAMPLNYSTYISATTFKAMHESVRMSQADPAQTIWTDLGSSALGITVYGCSRFRAP